ncbi:MAG: hypothetical protein M3069_18880, partial [Chloroflexota bacterium]|nr:hypothetical protein [Chloroflexota bacterium]
PRLRPLAAMPNDAPEARSRPVYFAEADGFVPCSVYDRYLLRAGMNVVGPAIVEEMDSTCVVHPGYSATVDKLGNLLLAPNGSESLPAAVRGSTHA